MRMRGRASGKPRSKPTSNDDNSHNALPPFPIPDGFILVCDTREQLPLFTRPPKGLMITTNTLPIGDYSIQGFETSVAIERKQLSDFISFIGSERDKTIKKLERMRDLDFAALVVEINESDILHKYEQTLRDNLGLWAADSVQIKAAHVRGFLISCNVKYRIHTYLTTNRDDISRWILDRLIRYYEYKRKGLI